MIDRDEQLTRLVGRGMAAYDGGRFAAAAELLAAYVRRRPDNGCGWFAYGDALRMLGLADEAERALVRADELTGGRRAWPRVRLAMVREQQGHRAAAEADYAAVAGHPDVATAGWYWVARGANLMAIGQLAAAERCGRAAVACDDADVGEAWLTLGHVLRAAGRYVEAADAYVRASGADRGAVREAVVSLDGVAEAILLAVESVER